MRPADQSRYRVWLNSRIPLVGHWLRSRARRELCRDGSAEACRLLAESAVSNGTGGSEAAVADLIRLAHGGNTPAREALCRIVIFHDDPRLRDEVLAAGYLPHEESHRALFLFLTQQWPEYEGLDYDRSLLRAAYLAGSRPLQQRIAACAREAGRLEWVDVAAGGRQGRRLDAMTEREWKTVVSLLSDGQHWPDLWRLAQDAPPRWSARLLQCLRPASWMPPEAERRGYRELVELASRWKDEDYRALMRCQAVLTGHRDEVRCLSLCRIGRLLASGSADATVRLWALPEGKAAGTLEGHKSAVTCLAADPDGRWLASGGKDHAVCLWQLPESRLHGKLLGHGRPISCMVIPPQGHMVISGGLDGRVQLWSLPRGEALASLDDHGEAIQCLAVTPDGTILASGGADATIKLWSLPDGERLRTLTGHRREDMDSVLCLAIDPQGRWLASGATDQTVRVWSLPDGAHLATLDDHGGYVGCLAFTRGGDVLISGGRDQMLRFWKTSTWKAANAFEAHCGEVAGLVTSADGALLVSRSGPGYGHDHSIRLWSLPGGVFLRGLYGHDRYVNCLTLSPDGRFLASGGADRTIRIWTAELARILEVPAARATPADLARIEAALGDLSLSDTERDALRFVSALLRWRKRCDIVVEDAGPHLVQAGAFDIEIEG